MCKGTPYSWLCGHGRIQYIGLPCDNAPISTLDDLKYCSNPSTTPKFHFSSNCFWCAKADQLDVLQKGEAGLSAAGEIGCSVLSTEVVATRNERIHQWHKAMFLEILKEWLMDEMKRYGEDHVDWLLLSKTILPKPNQLTSDNKQTSPDP